MNKWRWPGVVPDRPGLSGRSVADYTARDADGLIVGYCSFGDLNQFGELPDFALPAYVGVAAGLHPRLVGQGNGRGFMRAILELGRARFPGQTIAGVVKDSNQRSKKSVLAAGFVVHSSDPELGGVIVVDGGA